MAETPQGNWEQCGCGANKIDGVLQESAGFDNIKPKKISEIQSPSGLEFDILEKAKAISQNNIKIIQMIQQKTNINYTVISRQAKGKPDIAKAERIDAVKKQTEERIAALKNTMRAIKDPTLLTIEMDQIITMQMQALRNFNDRASITIYEKMLAQYSVAMGYDQNDIAKMLGITSKHMKLNIIPKTSFGTKLEKLGWHGRCPSPDCGVVIKDVLEVLASNPNASVDNDALRTTGYQQQVLDLQKENQKLKQILSEK